MSSNEDNNGGSRGFIALEMPTADTSQRSRLPRTATKEEMMEDASVPISRSFMDNIDMALWYKRITGDSDERHVTTLVARGISSLSTEGVTDEDLLEAYQDQFEGWNKELFDRVEGE